MTTPKVCVGCGQPAKYRIEAKFIFHPYWYCQTCHDEFMRSFDKLPVKRRKKVLKELTITALAEAIE